MNGVNNYQSGMKTGLDAYMNAYAKKAETTKAKEQVQEQKDIYEKSAVTETKSVNSVELSDKAKDLLERLKEKYSDADFIIANYNSDEEAKRLMAGSSKTYSVLMDPELLEQMAADEETEKKYTEILDNALLSLQEIQENLSDEDKESVVRVGVSIDKDGKVSYFAELEKLGEKQRERIEKAKAEKKEQAAKDEKKAEEKKREEELKDKFAAKELEKYAKGSESAKVKSQSTIVKADSVSDLIEQIKNVDWTSIKAQEAVVSGGFINFSV